MCRSAVERSVEMLPEGFLLFTVEPMILGDKFVEEI